MERLDKLVVYETDKGNHAVRPLNWAGIWDKDGKIKECGLNHIAVFHCKEDADWYAYTKNAEEQGLLLRLLCKVGDTIYKIPSKVNYNLNILNGHDENNRIYEQVVHSVQMWSADRYMFTTCEGLGGVVSDLYKETWFLTREEAEQALKQMGE